MQCKIFTKSLKSSNSCTGTLQIKQSLQTLIEFIHIANGPSTSVIQKGTHFGKRSLAFSHFLFITHLSEIIQYRPLFKLLL